MKKAKNSFARGLALTLAVFVLLFGAACLLLNRLDAVSDEAQIELVRSAIQNAAITCYAVEGSYPLKLEYLIENYGLSYNESRFMVTYEAFASNILPEIHVALKGVSSL